MIIRIMILLILVSAVGLTLVLWKQETPVLPEMKPFELTELTQQIEKTTEQTRDEDLQIWRKDIFRPVIESVQLPEQVEQVAQKVKEKKRVFTANITGILESRNENLAIVNRQVVRAGDYVHDAEVIRIEKDAVLFSRNGERIRIELRKR